VEPLRIGVIGCGNISGIYLQNLDLYEPVEVVACADLDLDKAKQAAERYEIARCLTVEELLQDESIEAVLNLTVPKAHAAVSEAALRAGKHVYSEKPLGVTAEEGAQLLSLAEEQGRRIGCAPDTFLGGGLQTCRKLIDEGLIGDPVGANCFMLCRGHESWHPAPSFYYEAGGGPLLDMGPYYLTALVALLGPVRRVSGSARISFATRTITSQPLSGSEIQVETPTHIVGVLDFSSGAIAQVTTSFDVSSSRMPCFEIYGSEGTLAVPDPNGFGGPVQVRKRGEESWADVGLTHEFATNSRGLGLMDMARAIRLDRPHRASGALAQHVLETMEAVLTASETSAYQEIQSKIDRPAPMICGPHETDLPD
jgi:predicted dehydrogenase